MKEKISKGFLNTSLIAFLAILITAPLIAATKGTIKITENDWTGQLIDINLAKIILEEHMDYNVELIFSEYSAQWVGMANGDLDVSMEVWPTSGSEAIKEWIHKKKKVEIIGDLGVTGSTGWWVPTYVIKGDAKRNIKPVAPNLKDWRQLNDYKKVFARIESGDKGFCVDSVASWENHNNDRIKALNIDFMNVYAGAEAPLLAEISSAYERGEPLLICDMWQPHWIFAKFDLTRIDLPPYTDECYGRVEGGPKATYACDFPVEKLINVSRVGFDKDFPEAYQFFKSMNISNADQQSMMYDVDVDGMKVEVAVRKWMKNNPDVWKSWIPKH